MGCASEKARYAWPAGPWCFLLLHKLTPSKWMEALVECFSLEDCAIPIYLVRWAYKGKGGGWGGWKGEPTKYSFHWRWGQWPMGSYVSWHLGSQSHDDDDMMMMMMMMVMTCYYWPLPIWAVVNYFNGFVVVPSSSSSTAQLALFLHNQLHTTKLDLVTHTHTHKL
jgi:hypothetical protein